MVVGEKKPDIIAIVETWLNNNISDEEIALDNYTLARRDRRMDIKTRGGGVMVYVNNRLKFFEMSGDIYSNFDAMWIKNFEDKKLLLKLGLFYRPPDGTESELHLLLNELKRSKGEDTVILGDFNFRDIDWTHSTSSTYGKLFLDEINSLALVQCVKKQTRGNSVLDLIFVYNRLIVCKIDYWTPIAKSDHNTLWLKLDVSSSTYKKIIKGYRYEKADYRVL